MGATSDRWVRSSIPAADKQRAPLIFSKMNTQRAKSLGNRPEQEVFWPHPARERRSLSAHFLAVSRRRRLGELNADKDPRCARPQYLLKQSDMCTGGGRRLAHRARCSQPHAVRALQDADSARLMLRSKNALVLF